MIDIAILAVPGLANRTPQAAPALLKGSVQAAGFSCKTFDFNIRVYHDTEQWEELELYFNTQLNSEQASLAQSLVEKWVDEVLEHDPKYIGISVFTFQSCFATKMFCQQIRKRSTAKIILGGQGISSAINGEPVFAKSMITAGQADYFIRSEGEIALVELLKGNLDHPGICTDHFEQIKDLDALPYADYSDYILPLYERALIPITGSRGCVRTCSFCDIHQHWKYAYRSGKRMADELIHQHQAHGITEFFFTDSLINGNLKMFREFIKTMAEYNKTQENPPRWSGQFIVRSEREVNEDYWRLIAESGGNRLSIGVETGSERVRKHMNKNFTNADLDYTMSKLEQYNITCKMLMIVGYPTETEEDVQDTIDMFTRYQHLAGKIIHHVNLGSTAMIIPGSPLWDMREELGFLRDPDSYLGVSWHCESNPDMTIAVRFQRRARILEHLNKLNYRLEKDEHDINVMKLAAHMDKLEQGLEKARRVFKIRPAS